ncbi:DUF402 domain-containing protein [Longispora sp. NPDC051575]|uniref:DUF402 domain-containing protein n=1 Tax=Longispora sp. NPDC051575 TaxID=3154943 RepID=UPI0034276416
MIGDEVQFTVRKYDGSLHWHFTMLRLGEDDHGVWLGAPVGTVFSKADQGPIRTSTSPLVTLVPRETWWTASFYGTPARLDAYCDVTTPSRWLHPGEVTMIDLDLDACRERDTGRVYLDDEDEFADHQVRYSYPPDMIARAGDTADWLTAALRDATEPFASRYRTWLDRITGPGPAPAD